eukprot:gene11358-7864_t
MLRHSCRVCVWLGGTASTPTMGLDVRPPAGSYLNVQTHTTASNHTAPLHRRSTAAHFHPSTSSQAVAFLEPEQRQLLSSVKVGQPQSPMRKYIRQLRADIYDELLKLPLRFALHDFDTLERHLYGTSQYTWGGAPEERQENESWMYPLTCTSHPSAVGAATRTTKKHDESQPFYAVGARLRSGSVGYAPPLGPADTLDTIPFFVHRTSTGMLPGRIFSMNYRNLMPAFYLRIGNIDGDIFRFEEELLKLFPTKKIFVRRHAIYIYNVNMDGNALVHHWLLGLGF